MKSSIRVRFAPAPTGFLHIGNLRSALFNWLFARHTNGTFLLRIEDTDRAVYKPEYERAIIESLRWMGIDWDEPPLIQSSRIDEHKAVVARLLAEKKAYKCYCLTKDPALEYHKYDGRCRDRTDEPDGVYVIRIKLPSDQAAVTFHDIIHGDITVAMDQLDDFIIVRSDGNPVYNLVVVIDDIFMRITHIIRGEDHIPNTPKQVMIYRALGKTPPYFAHLPLILGSTGAKLSKRDAAVSVKEYRALGYLSDALFNYLVRLGWAYKDQEVFTRAQMIDLFTLEAVGKSGAMFDIQKLNWMNGVYLRAATSQMLLDHIISDVNCQIKTDLRLWSDDTILAAIDLYKDRVSNLAELVAALRLLHDGPTVIDSVSGQWCTIETKQQMQAVRTVLEQCQPFDTSTIGNQLKAWTKQAGVSFAAIAQPLRYALLGTIEAPGVKELLAIAGKEETLRRIDVLSKLFPG
jgi:glutamyl-tRNA synthetase